MLRKRERPEVEKRGGERKKAGQVKSLKCVCVCVCLPGRLQIEDKKSEDGRKMEETWEGKITNIRPLDFYRRFLKMFWCIYSEIQKNKTKKQPISIDHKPKASAAQRLFKAADRFHERSESDRNPTLRIDSWESSRAPLIQWSRVKMKRKRIKMSERMNKETQRMTKNLKRQRKTWGVQPFMKCTAYETR